MSLKKKKKNQTFDTSIDKWNFYWKKFKYKNFNILKIVNSSFPFALMSGWVLIKEKKKKKNLFKVDIIEFNLKNIDEENESPWWLT